jgi:multicomponent K+:H+ antiporter subunit A
VRSLASFIMPFTLVLAATHVLLGHDQPGDGFTAGVILSLGIATWYVAFGYEETKRRLGWLRPSVLIASGLGLALLSSTAAAIINGNFFSPVDFGQMLGIAGLLPKGVYFSTATLFELSICVSVTGSAVLILDTLGHPRDADLETEKQMADIAVLRTQGAVTLPEDTEGSNGK